LPLADGRWRRSIAGGVLRPLFQREQMPMTLRRMMPRTRMALVLAAAHVESLVETVLDVPVAAQALKGLVPALTNRWRFGRAARARGSCHDPGRRKWSEASELRAYAGASLSDFGASSFTRQWTPRSTRRKLTRRRIFVVVLFSIIEFTFFFHCRRKLFITW